MYKIKILCCFILILSFVAVASAVGINVFQYANIEYIDAISGKNFRNVNSPLDFNNIDKIKASTISINDRNGFNTIKLAYENGLLIKEESNAHEKTVMSYVYDENKNIINLSPGFSFKYIDRNCRDRFYQADFQGREKIIKDRNKVTFVFEGKFNTKKEDLQKKRMSEYFINDENNLDSIIITYFRYNGSIYGKTSIKYEYEDGLPIKISETYADTNSSCLRSTVSIEYDELFNISKIIWHSNTNRDEDYEIVYSDYDGYGNWHLSRKYRGEVLVEIIERQILYK